MVYNNSLRTLRRHAAAVAGVDVNDVQAVVCLTAGNAILRDENGTDLTYALTAGQVLNFAARRLVAGSTGTYAFWF